MTIKLDQFSGIAPKMADHLLSSNMATVAQNCRIDRGSLMPLKAPSTATSVSNTANSIFYYEPQSMWLYWAESGVDAVMSPVNNDTWNRMYWTGEYYPKYTYQTRPTVGNPNGFRLGVPAPGIAPTLGKSGTPSGTPVDRYYIFTYVTPQGEEGPPSPVSASINVTPAETVRVTFTADDLTTYNLGSTAYRRIYRLVTGTTDSAYQLVAQQTITADYYDDTKLDTQLGEIIPSVYWRVPPTGLKGLKATPHGFLVGFDGNTLYTSELYLPHAWNPYNVISFPSTITALAITGDSIVVFTTKMPYMVTGSAPDGLSAIQIDVPQTCASKSSIANMGGFIMFASPDGLCRVSANDMTVMTENFLTRDQWQAYSPATMRGFCYEGIYIGFSNTKAFMFDVRTDPAVLTEISGYSYLSGYQDLINDRLYLLHDNGNIDLWEGGPGASMTWKSKPERSPIPTCPTVLRIYATGNVGFQLWADGTSIVWPTTITSSTPVRLPAGYKAKEFQLQLTASGSTEIQSVAIAHSMEELL